jgi:hypothetical protein
VTGSEQAKRQNPVQNSPSTANGKDPKGQKNKKKPLYKRVWFWILVVVVLIIIGAAVGGSNGSSSSKSSVSSSSTAQKDSANSSATDSSVSTGGSSDSADASSVSYENWEKISLSSDSGSTKADVEKLLGKKADSTSSTTVMNVQTELLTWTGLKDGTIGSGITVNFQNDHAVVKAVTGLKVDRPSKITLAQYQKIANGQNKQAVESEVGKPDGISTMDLAGQKTETWSYMTGVNGGMGANFQVTFTGDTVSSFSQSNMK